MGSGAVGSENGFAGCVIEKKEIIEPFNFLRVSRQRVSATA